MWPPITRGDITFGGALTLPAMRGHHPTVQNFIVPTTVFATKHNTKNEIFLKRFSAIWAMDISPFTSNAQRFATSILCNSLKMCSLHKSVNVKSLYLAKISRTLGHYWAIALRNFVITDNLVTSNEGYFFTWEIILLFGLYGVAD